MWLDLLVIGPLWLMCVIGMLASRRKKPGEGCNREQATRNNPIR